MAAIIAIGVKEKPAKPTMSLPVDALSADGAEPEVGDEVEHSIKGTIASIKGDMATVNLTALDGQPIEGSPEEEASESPEEEQSEGYLRSLSPPEELAAFLSIRGMCLRDLGRTHEAAESFSNAAKLAPAVQAYRKMAERLQESSTRPRQNKNSHEDIHS